MECFPKISICKIQKGTFWVKTLVNIILIPNNNITIRGWVRKFCHRCYNFVNRHDRLLYCGSESSVIGVITLLIDMIGCCIIT